MIDIHSHVLPGIDDGADSLEETTEMCRRAAEDGCTGIIATPHLRHTRWWNGNRRKIEALHEQVRQHFASAWPVDAGTAPELYLGAEVALHSESIEEIYDLPDGDLLTLAGTRYVLIELDWQGLGPHVLDVVHELRIKGLFPIIAHPERVSWLAANAQLMEALIDGGAYFQLTSMSLTGQLGARIRQVCEDLLRHDMVHFIASDMHDTRLRPPGLKTAYRQVESDFGPETARRIFIHHPRALVRNQPLDAPPG